MANQSFSNITFDLDKLIDEIHCPICFEIFEDPIMELLNQHILCDKCLKNCNSNQLNLKCPICKLDIISTINPRPIINTLNLITTKCSSKYKDKEYNWEGNGIEYHKHLRTCEILKQKNQDIIKELYIKLKNFK